MRERKEKHTSISWTGIDGSLADGVHVKDRIVIN